MSIAKAKKLLKAAPLLGAGNVLKAISSFAPGIGSFVSGAFTAGYAADQIAEFLENKFRNPDERRQRALLESRAAQGVARPDERAHLSQMEQRANPLEAAGAIAKMGAQLGGGLSALSGEIQQRETEQKAQRQAESQATQAQRQAEEERAYERERQARLDAERERVQREDDLRKRRYEERAIERHTLSMNKGSGGSKKPSSIPKTVAKTAAPSDYADAIRELDALINRIR